MLYQIILATLIGGALALMGGIILLFKEDLTKRISFILVSFAAGALLGTAFLEILPEALEGGNIETVFGFVIIGFLTVFIFEKFLGWYHFHGEEEHEPSSFSAQTIIFGDTLHNFVDGIAIALSFSISPQLGIATTVAAFFHEIPQEIGDFAVLLQQGYKRSKVLMINLFSSSAAVVGGILGYFILPVLSEKYIFYALGFTAGSFIYISASDLIPEIRSKFHGKFSLRHILSIIGGILIVVLLSYFIPE